MLKHNVLMIMERLNPSVWALAHWWELLPNYNVRTVVCVFPWRLNYNAHAVACLTN
ncbi:hypothetical protein [Wolbachia endosymbiont (group A) of Bibio marci]|uniref:hypothetical protein n=1 Tax=Wolbachia endosymbiont (group A) of Bibio marci TaxID=2953987 RepID=UPI00222F17B7|nr:hypothetical protein [Wolbachia endosymbiont (group A) of Bibio marci]